MATVGRVVVLIWVDILALYSLYIMMAYLTNVWEVGFTHAAAIVNIFWGVATVSPLLLLYIAETITGHYLMLLLSSISYSIGLGLLSMSTPPVLANATGTCSEYKSECIGHDQKVLFYVALPLICFGMAGHLTSYNIFMAEQLSNEDLQESTFWRYFCGILAVIIVYFVAVLGLPYVKPWSLRFGIPAICTLVATLLFISGSCSYKYYKPRGSALIIFVRVFVAAALKMFYRVPKDPKDLYEVHHPYLYTVPHTKSLRCLDKAAIIIPTKPLVEQENDVWRLSTVTDVEETKIIIRMIPVWMTFLLCGVVSAVGFTYFVEQLDHMNHKVGGLKVPSAVLLWFYDQFQNLFAKLYVKLANLLGEHGSKKYAPPIGIAASMIVAIICCITAAKVESQRLGVVQRHGLVQKPDETVPMTMFWLLPQFVLLGGFQGLFNSSAICFFADQSPQVTKRYLPYFVMAVFGVGILGSVGSVSVIGKVSERGGRMNWFQHDMNGSRLDKYYWTLAWLMAANLVVFGIVAMVYRYKESKLAQQQAPEFGGINEAYDDDAKCCCCC